MNALQPSCTALFPSCSKQPQARIKVSVCLSARAVVKLITSA